MPIRLTNRSDLYRFLCGVLLSFAAVLIYIPTVIAVTTKFLILTTVLLWVILGEAPDWTRLPVRRSFILYFVLMGWLVGTSLVDGFLIDGNYIEYFQNAGLFTVFFLLDRWRLWGLMLFLVFLVWAGKSGDNRHVLTFMLVAYLLALLGGYLPYVAGQQWLTGEPFLVWGNWNTNSSKLINIFVIFTLAGLVRYGSRNRVVSTASLLLFYAGVAAIYMIQSRAGIGSLLIMSAGFAMYYLYRNRSLSGVLKTAAVACGAFLLIVNLPATSHRGMEGELEKTLNRGLLGGRYRVIWPMASRLILERRWLGHAMGTYVEKVRELPDHPGGWQANVHPHNVFLQVLYDGGFIGLALFFLFVAQFVREIVNRIRAGPPETRDFMVALLLTFLGNVVLHGGVEPFNYGYLALLMCWGFFPGVDSGPARPPGTDATDGSPDRNGGPGDEPGRDSVTTGGSPS